MSNHGESIKSCWRRTTLPLNVEPQTVSPADSELLGEMGPWLGIILAALCFGRYQTVTHYHGHMRGHNPVGHMWKPCEATDHRH